MVVLDVTQEKIIEIIKHAIAAIFLILISACGENRSSVELGIGAEQGISIPLAIRDLTGGSINIYLTCGWPDGTRLAMEIDQAQGMARASCSGLAPEETSFYLEIEFVPDTQEAVMLANATKLVQLVAGENNLAFAESDYVYLDDDGDNLTNLSELENGTDPKDPVCIIGFSIIGSCEIGA